MLLLKDCRTCGTGSGRASLHARTSDSTARDAARPGGVGSAGMALGPGDPLPSVPLTAADGTTADLAGFRGEACVLIFLRHLG